MFLVYCVYYTLFRYILQCFSLFFFFYVHFYADLNIENQAYFFRAIPIQYTYRKGRYPRQFILSPVRFRVRVCVRLGALLCVLYVCQFRNTTPSDIETLYKCTHTLNGFKYLYPRYAPSDIYKPSLFLYLPVLLCDEKSITYPYFNDYNAPLTRANVR